MIYQTLLGEDFDRLHPKLQERYSLPLNEPFEATGVMHTIEAGSKLLLPFYQLATKFNFLFPESGRNIPFKIRNNCRQMDNGDYEVQWERTFYFENKKRRFDALMTIDTERKIVKDYLGSPALFYSDLHFSVTNEGRLLIRSGIQRFVMKSLEISLPALMEGRVIVEEGYDDALQVYTIHVSIMNPIMGRLMMYAGQFTKVD
ncbi:DUF4166 domain-containing protein [Bacillus ndiopicus]|uniref:DUF4166 domain-containing protein n=1 Tax=Bacillus ndiopicus TaxID=1347368 RepID=UPI0005A5E10F|nr:DUF4166 domain-containing protein [Bacillus ndiopicus]